MPERRNDAYKNLFPWNQFLAELDLKVLSSGLAYNISTWKTLQGVAGDIFYRFYLPLTGKFKLIYPDGSCLIEPGNLYLIPCSTPFKYEALEPCTHYWIHFISKQLQTTPVLSYPHGISLTDPEATHAKINDVFERIKTSSTFADAVMIKNTVTELLVPFLEKCPTICRTRLLCLNS